jgi:hypothetical protein
MIFYFYLNNFNFGFNFGSNSWENLVNLNLICKVSDEYNNLISNYHIHKLLKINACFFY